MSTLHFKDSELEIHKVVVGPMDNNVFVLRCRQSGEGLLIDAANAVSYTHLTLPTKRIV